MKEQKMWKRFGKRALSLGLAFLLVLTSFAGVLPGRAYAAEADVNLALGKEVTIDAACNQDPQLVTDGETYANDATTLYIRGQGDQNYLTIDLGDSYEVGRIKYFGFVPQDAGYTNQSNDMVFMLSNDPAFPESDRTIVFNTDADNTWGFGEGTDKEELNNHSGRMIEFEPVTARYVRYYQYGRTQLSTPGYVQDLTACEIEVYGSAAPVEPETGNNLAPQAEVTATSVYEDNTAAYGPQLAIDEDLSTAWASYCKQGVTWDGTLSMTLTWDRLVTVDRLKLYPGCDANHSDNELEVSYTAMDIDGNVIGSGKKVATGLDGSFAEIQLEEPLTGVKSIRFQTLPVIDKGGDAYGMREAMVFGEFEADKPIASLKPVTVNTYVGRAPKLPETVEATHENGLTSNPAVVWDAIDPALYAESGSFTVEGTVEGTELKAVATVYVAPASAATIEAGMLELHLDGLGQVTGLYVDGEDFLTTEPDGKLMPLVSLMVKDHERVNPTAMTYDSENKVLDFTFEAINVHALISLQDKGNYTSLTLTEVQNPDHVRIEAILWGPVKTTINTGGQTVGTAYNDEYAIGMHMLNLKTVGGWPIELDAKNECYHSDLPLKNGHTDPRSNRQPHTNTAVFATWGSALRGYTWDYTEDTMRTVSDYSTVPQLQPAMKGTYAEEDASMIGSSIALYGTRTANILNVISNIELTENLPHPTINGKWQKESIETAQDFLVYNDAIWGLDVVENDAKMANAAGIQYIYGQYGATGPWNGDGSYSFNGLFGGSDDAVRQMVAKAGEYGVYVGTHTLSNLISGGTQYTSPYATSGLAYAGFAALTRDVEPSDMEIYVDDGHPFSDVVVAASNGCRYIRIGDEIVSFTGCEKVGDSEWKLTLNQRGCWTTAAKHVATERAYKLWNYYTAPFLGGWDSLEPMTKRMGEIYSDMGVHCMSYDAFEALRMCEYSTLAQGRMKQNVYNNVKDGGAADGFITETSDMATSCWDVHSRISWGESNTALLLMMNSISYYRQNFYPAMLGWMYNHGNHGGYGEAQLLMNLSMKGGWNAGAGWYVNRNTFKSYPHMPGMLKTWNNAIQRGAFTVGEAYTAEIQDAMRNAWVNNRVWTLEETVADQEWVLQEVNKSNLSEKIGEPVTLTATNDIESETRYGDIATNVSLEYSRAHTGDTITVYVQPYSGHKLVEGSLQVNGGDCQLTATDREGVYTFTMPDADVTITADFEETNETEYKVSVKPVPGGKITVDGAKAAAGEAVAASYTANPGYVLHKDGFTANGEAISDSFTMPERDVTVTARFDKISYNVEKFESRLGSVMPDQETAEINDEVLLRIQPANGCSLKRLTVNGEDVTADVLNNRYTFTMLPEDIEVAAEFTLEEGGKINLALKQPVTLGAESTDNPALVTDGNTYANDASTLYIREKGMGNYLTIDLGESYSINEIKYFGFVPQDAGYTNQSNDMVFMLSNDPEFPEDDRTIVFNTDADNTWGFGEGTDEEELNTHDGRLITFEPVVARYVRYYQYGRTQLSTPGYNQFLTACEIEVYGDPTPVEPTADKSELEALYNANVNKENENYTEESWTAFQTALAEAKAVLDKAEATQEEVDAAKAALEAAIAGLTVNAGEITDAEKSILKDLLDEASKLDESKYTEETWKVLTEAVNTAKALIGNDEATVEQIKAAEEALRAAIDDLEEKPVEVKEETVVVRAVVNGDKSTAKTIFTGKAPHGANLVEWLNENVTVEPRTGYEADTWYNWDWFGHKHNDKATVNGWTNVYVTYNKIPMVNVVVKSVENGDKSTAKTIWSGKAPKGAVLTEWLSENVKVSVPDGFNWDNTWMNWDWFGHKFSSTVKFNGWTNVYVNFTNK